MEIVWFHSAQSPNELSALLRKHLESRGCRVQEDSKVLGDEKEQSIDLIAEIDRKEARAVIMEHKTTKNTSVHFEIGEPNFEMAGFMKRMLDKEKTAR